MTDRDHPAMSRPSIPPRTPQRSASPQSAWLTVLRAVLALLPAILKALNLFRSSPPTSRRSRPVTHAPVRAGDDGGIAELFAQRRSDVIVSGSGLIVKVLPDDLDMSDGSEQHQKFLVELHDTDRLTICICHNIKFGRLPSREGATVHFRGEYEYNERGGTVHWTHRDPRGTHEDGWIDLDGTRYGNG